MISSLKSCLIASPCALAAALLAFAFGFGGGQASAEDLETISCSLQTEVLDYSVELAEELDVLCHSLGAEAQASAKVDVETAAEVDHPPTAVENQQPRADESSPPAPLAIEGQAIEGQAIPVEITQSVTIAVLGQSDEGNQELDITGSVPFEPKIAPEPDSQAPGPAE
jgi:hypothetical protein